MFCGNKTIYSILTASAKNQALPHALLLCGPAQIGKTTLGIEIAKATLGKIPHPDFWFFESQDNWKLEQIKDLQNFLSTSAFSGKFKVALLPQADLMTEEAGNAMLKILEEPPENRLIIFTAEKKENLMPTIASRTSSFHLYPVPEKEIEEFLISLKTEQTKAAQIASLSLGRPGKAKVLLENPALFERAKKIREFLKQNKNAPLFKIFALSEKISKMPEIDQRDFWEELLFFVSQSKSNIIATDLSKLLKYHLFKRSFVQPRLIWDNFLWTALR